MEICGNLAEVWCEIKASSRKVYVYSIRHEGQPFYIGVGTGRRIVEHERHSQLKKPNAKATRMREILAAGGILSYGIHGWFDDWSAAAAEERRLISLYGRADLGLGCLTNLTNGGQGTSGIAWYGSPKRVDGARKAAEKNRGRTATAEHRAKIGAAHKGKIVSAETLAKMSAAVKGRPLSEEHRKKLSEAKMGRPPSQAALVAGARWREENADAVSTARKKLWANPAYREKMLRSFKRRA